MNEDDRIERHMRHAIRLSAQGVGRTGVNPSVGCVILDRRGLVAAAARTADGGRPHAETRALSAAGTAARGGQAFVTLEPCAHQGQTGPCAKALIEAGIKQVFIGCEDPDPRVCGKGADMLRAGGVEVRTGILGQQCAEPLEGFFSRIIKKRPFITVKTATSLDGKTALENGKSKWITGAEARRLVHLQRARADALMVGSTTVRADRPRLDVRVAGLEPFSPVAVVIDGQGTLGGTLGGTLKGDPPVSGLRDPLVLSRDTCRFDGKHIDLHHAMEVLGEAGFSNLYVESGGGLTTALLRAGLTDRLIWFRAPKVLGDDARGAVSALNLHELVAAPLFKRVSFQTVGEDTMEIYEPCSPD